MKKIKVVTICLLVISLIITTVIGVNKYLAWPVRFRSELNKFYGKDNWECITEEKKESIIYKEYYSTSDYPYSYEIPGKFKNWYIKFENKNNEVEIWRISNHAYKINNDKYWFFSSKRLSNKQALGQELMDISFQIIGENIKDEIISNILTEEQINCLKVEMSYLNGNPNPDFYSNLLEKTWFNVNDIKAENYLSLDSNKFYIDILAYDYKVEKLLEIEKQNLYDSIHELELKLLEKYGDNASFKIHFNQEYNVEYISGVKQ